MKIKYRQQHNKQKRARNIGAIAVVVSIVILFTVSFFLQGSRYVSYVYAGAGGITVYAQDSLATIFSLFEPKQALLRENQSLREALREAQMQDLQIEMLKLENEALRTTQINTPGDTLGRIIDYRQHPYGTLLLRTDDKVMVGDIAHYGEIALGTVIESYKGVVKVKLFMSGGVSKNVFVSDNNVTVMNGYSGFGEIDISRNAMVKLGDPVMLPEAAGMLVGYVAEVQHADEDAFQTVVVKIPFSIMQIKFLKFSNASL